MSRHTILTSGLSRTVIESLPDGLEDYELVVYLEPDAKLRMVAEPTERRIGRNEELMNAEFDLLELFTKAVVPDDGEPIEEAEETEAVEPAAKSTGDVEKKLKRVLTKLVVADTGDGKEGYAAKVALLKAMEEEFGIKHYTEKKTK